MRPLSPPPTILVQSEVQSQDAQPEAEESSTVTSTCTAVNSNVNLGGSSFACKDVGVLLQSDLSDELKLDVVLNFSAYNPSVKYSFPSKVEYGKNRFQYHYLKSFCWLGYSVQLILCT